MKPNLIKMLSVVFIVMIAATVPAHASVVAYQWDEGGAGNGVLSGFTSFHNTTGPVLADDFVPIVGGDVYSVSWWGSRTPSSTWELTFHADTIDPADGLHEPAITLPSGGLSQHFVTAAGSDPDGDGVFKYTALWTPQDLMLTAGLTYWFSVANSGFNGWQWALTDGIAPAVGTQAHAPVRSVDGQPSQIIGPHDGPWTPLVDAGDLAFQVNVVPVPAAVWLFGTALVGFIGFSRRRKIA